MAKGVAICALLVVAMAHLMLEPASAITCGQVNIALSQCVPYLIGKAPEPAPGCCEGIISVKNSATTTPDRQLACGCMKEAAAHLPGLKEAAVAALPGKCNTPLPFPISSNVDCTQIH